MLLMLVVPTYQKLLQLTIRNLCVFKTKIARYFLDVMLEWKYPWTCLCKRLHTHFYFYVFQKSLNLTPNPGNWQIAVLLLNSEIPSLPLNCHNVGNVKSLIKPGRNCVIHQFKQFIQPHKCIDLPSRNLPPAHYINKQFVCKCILKQI